MFDLSIDENKCNACGVCVEICKTQKFVFNENNEVELNNNECVYCYDCVSMCPEFAITSTVNYLKTLEKNKLKTKELIDFINTKRTAGFFDNGQIQSQILEEIISSVKYSPSFKNKHKLHFTVMQNQAVHNLLIGIKAFFKRLLEITNNKFYRAMLNAFSSKQDKYYYSKEFISTIRNALNIPDKDLILKNAGAVILIHSNEDFIFGAEEAVIAAERVAFLAHAHGISSAINVLVPAGINKNYKLKNALGFDKHEKVYACVLLGYEKFARILDVYREPPVINYF